MLKGIRMGFIIVLAAPVFFLAMAIEWWWGWRLSKRGPLSAKTYRLDDAINSISLGIISQLSAVFTRVFRITIYTLVFEQVAVFDNPDFWQSVWGACLALVLYDFCYYWYHRASHEVAFFGVAMWCTTKVSTTTCPPRCDKPRQGWPSVGCFTCPWRSWACPRWCLASWR